LTGLRSAKRGEVEIEVTFEINSEGIVSVAARDKETGQKQSITVTASGGLTEDELQRILEEQGDYMLEARVSDELKNKRGELDAVMKEVGDLLPKVQQVTEGSEFGVDAVAKAVKGLESARRVRDGGNLAAVSEAVDTLNRTLNLFRGVIQRIGTR
jgi:molecular chaperone DnaK